MKTYHEDQQLNTLNFKMKHPKRSLKYFRKPTPYLTIMKNMNKKDGAEPALGCPSVAGRSGQFSASFPTCRARWPGDPNTLRFLIPPCCLYFHQSLVPIPKASLPGVQRTVGTDEG